MYTFLENLECKLEFWSVTKDTATLLMFTIEWETLLKCVKDVNVTHIQKAGKPRVTLTGRQGVLCNTIQRDRVDSAWNMHFTSLPTDKEIEWILRGMCILLAY